MIGAKIDSGDLVRLVSALNGTKPKADRAMRRAMQLAGLRCLAYTKRNASGRPGPRFRTGDYRRSLNLTFRDNGLTAVIGSGAPQAQRLEEGFVGRDSLDRVYNQPSYPHFRPAAEQTMREMDEIVTQAIGEIGGFL